MSNLAEIIVSRDNPTIGMVVQDLVQCPCSDESREHYEMRDDEFMYTKDSHLFIVRAPGEPDRLRQVLVVGGVKDVFLARPIGTEVGSALPEVMLLPHGELELDSIAQLGEKDYRYLMRSPDKTKILCDGSTRGQYSGKRLEIVDYTVYQAIVKKVADGMLHGTFVNQSDFSDMSTLEVAPEIVRYNRSLLQQ